MSSGLGKELEVKVALDTPDKIVSTADGLRLVFNPADTRKLSELGHDPHDEWGAETVIPSSMMILTLPTVIGAGVSLVANALFALPDFSYWMFIVGGIAVGVVGNAFFIPSVFRTLKYRKLWRELVDRTTTALENWVYKQYQLVFEPEDMQLWAVHVLDGMWQRNSDGGPSVVSSYHIRSSRLDRATESPVISSSMTGRKYRLEQNSHGLWVVSPVSAVLHSQSEVKRGFSLSKKDVGASSPALSGLSAYTNVSEKPAAKMPRKVAASVDTLENRFAIVGSQNLSIEAEHVVLRARSEFTEAMERFNRLQVLNVDGSSDVLDVVNGLVAELDDIIADEVEWLRKGSAKQRELLRSRQSEKSGLQIEAE